MSSIKCLHIVAFANRHADVCMHLLDVREDPICETGPYVDWEAKFAGVDTIPAAVGWRGLANLSRITR